MIRPIKILFAGGRAALAALALMGCVATGCVTDPVQQTPDGDPTEARVSITVTVPGAVVPTTRSMDGAGEAAVEEIDIVVFTNPASGSGEFVEKVGTEIIEWSGRIDPVSGEYEMEVTFEATLQGSSAPRTIALFANASTEVREMDMEGLTKQQVLEGLVHGAIYVAEGEADEAIPMYGEKNVSAITAAMTEIGRVSLERMLARVDIIDAAENFIVREIRYMHNSVGYMAPMVGSGGEMIIPAGAEAKYGTIENEAEGIERVSGQLYIPEALNRSGVEGSDDHKNSPHLLIRGEVTGDSGNEYWYRVDFTDGDNPRPDTEYVDVERNHLYTFTITTVEGRGYDTPKEAQESLGVLSNLKTSLFTVDQRGIMKINYNGQYWLGVEETDVELAAEGETCAIKVATNYGPGWEIATIKIEDGDPIPYVDYMFDDSNWLGIDVEEDRLVFSAGDNSDKDGRRAVVHLIAGRLTHMVTVTQPGRDVDTEKWVLEVNDDNLINYSYNGGTQKVTVTSHDGSLSDDGSIGNPVPWDVTEYSVDGGVTWIAGRPDYLTFEKDAEDQVTTELSLTLGMGVLASTTEDPDDMFTDEVKGSAESVAARWNVASSTGGDTEETANCYIIDAPGYYRLPLYYGNAIKGGLPNPDIVNYTGSTFVNHAGDPITVDPIAGADNAVIVWQDSMTGEPTTISGVDVKDGYLIFDVGIGADMVQGNALIAVRDAGGTIMWSWHLWITPLVAPFDSATDRITTPVSPIVSYELMKYNLGWVQGETTVFHARSEFDLKIRVAQPSDGESREITLVQYGTGSMAGPDGKTYAPSEGYNVYYQYGRKDPMPHSSYHTNKAFEWGTEGSTNGFPLETAIQHPYRFYRGSGSNKYWCSTEYWDLWDVGNTAEGASTLADVSIAKSVYDPCPPGFSMPPGNAFRRFTTTGNNSGTDNIPAINVASLNLDDEDKGWWMYTIGVKEGPTAFFPLSGYYNENTTGNVIQSGIRGRYWTAMPVDDDQAYHVLLSSEEGYQGYQAAPIRNSDSRNKSYGCAVRPIANQPGVPVP